MHKRQLNIHYNCFHAVNMTAKQHPEANLYVGFGMLYQIIYHASQTLSLVSPVPFFQFGTHNFC